MIHTIRNIVAGSVGASVLFATVAFAQTAPEQESDRAAQRQGAVQAELEASSQAIRALNNPNCQPITYADVLAKPDDIDINVCFALQQINTGNVRGAAATLERILLLAPGALNVRYLYAIVLYRLDSVDEAEQEFKAVQTADLPPDVAREVENYLEEIDRRRQRTKQSITVSVGSYYDTNRNSAPQSESQEALGVTAPIALHVNRPNDSVGFLTILSYDFTHDPGFQNQHELFGGVDLYADSVTEQSRLDVHSASFDVGARLRYPGFVFTPRAFVTSMRLDWSKFYQAEGLELRVDHKHKVTGLDNWPLLDTFASFTMQDEDYHNTPNYGSLTLRSGNKYTTKAGIGALVDPDHYVQVVGQAEFKSSAPDNANNNDARVFSYKYYNVEANHTWLLGDGHFLLTNLMLGYRQYKAADSLVVGAGGERRKENPSRFRMTYGMPLTDLAGDSWLMPDVNSNNMLQEFFNGATVALTGEVNYQRSNITNFQYTNRRVQLMLTRRLDF